MLMFKNVTSFRELKRLIYYFILPGVLIATITTLILQVTNKDYTFEFYANILFVIAFFIGWLLVYLNRGMTTAENLILVIVYSYHLTTVTGEIIKNAGVEGNQGMGTFIVWMPLIIMYTFMILKKWHALWASTILLVLSIIPGLYYYNELGFFFRDSLLQLYISNAVYIVILFISYRLFQVQVDIEAMRRQLYLDPLTQVGNRRQIDVWLEGSITKVEEKKGLSLLFFDIDRFKRINDRFGHKIGDDVLIELIRVVQDELKEGQCFGRWGGEEFIIIVHVSECEAYEIAEKLRKTIEDHNFGKVGPVTASFGVTGYKVGDTVETFLVRADERLYASKGDGRNLVTGKNVSPK